MNASQMSTCPAAKALLSKVVEQQQQRGAGPLRVRCLPTAPPGKWQPEGSWDPLENTILVQCNNDPKVQVGTLLFELLNAQASTLPPPRDWLMGAFTPRSTSH